MESLLLLFLLFTKHLLLDFKWQTPYMWKNKGTYGHPGGILHAGLHALVTVHILCYFTTAGVILAIGIAEFLIHYHMDWFKMSYNKKKGWGPTTHEEFWFLTGIDQWVHALTYLLIALVVMEVP